MSTQGTNNLSFNLDSKEAQRSAGLLAASITAIGGGITKLNEGLWTAGKLTGQNIFLNALLSTGYVKTARLMGYTTEEVFRLEDSTRNLNGEIGRLIMNSLSPAADSIADFNEKLTELLKNEDNVKGAIGAIFEEFFNGRDAVEFAKGAVDAFNKLPLVDINTLPIEIPLIVTDKNLDNMEKANRIADLIAEQFNFLPSPDKLNALPFVHGLPSWRELSNRIPGVNIPTAGDFVTDTAPKLLNNLPGVNLPTFTPSPTPVDLGQTVPISPVTVSVTVNTDDPSFGDKVVRSILDAHARGML